MRTLRLADRWHRLLATVRWIDERQVPGMYVRQMDAPGVDTKFIEGNRGVLTKLLDLQLPSGRVDIGAGDFERRYGFRRKPGYVRFRLNECDGWRELTVRAEDSPTWPFRARLARCSFWAAAMPCRCWSPWDGLPTWTSPTGVTSTRTDSPFWIGCGGGFAASSMLMDRTPSLSSRCWPGACSPRPPRR